MGLAPHDLLRLGNPAIDEPSQPIWVCRALARAPFVVVRRAHWMKDQMPVGIRGSVRNERYTTFLPRSAFVARISPEQLAQERTWEAHPHWHGLGALRGLSQIASQLAGFAWGPTGSVGFELASGVPTLTPASDLDLVIRVPERLSQHDARQLAAMFAAAPVPIDVQLETPYGAVLLNDYVSDAPHFLLRTLDGPRLVRDPWACPEPNETHT